MPRALPALVALVLLALAAAPAADAKPGRGPCRPGDPSSPTCLIWSAKVKFIADGDTIAVDIDGDGTKREYRVRIASYNAPELRVYSKYPNRRRNHAGACRGVEATALLERAIRKSHMRVRLAALHASSRSGRSRLRRSVQVKGGGRWVDNGPNMVRSGLVLWLPNQTENAWNDEYSAIAQEAQAKGVGLWSTTSCGAGPEAGARLRLRVKWNADGNDYKNVNGEWIEVTNLDTSKPVRVGGWTIRVSDLRHLVLPSFAQIPAGGHILIHMGRGTAHDTSFYFGSRHAFFGPAGEGAYLFDPQGDPRAWMLYPCRFACTDPLQGALRLQASPIGQPEFVTIRNVSGSTVDLNSYYLEFPYKEYPFGSNSMVQPGETMRVDVQGNPERNTRLQRYYGYNGYMLSDGGGRVRVQGHNDLVIACDSWGRGFSC